MKPFTMATGFIAVAVGTLALAGWALDIGTLKSVRPTWALMVPNTAVGFVMLGLALLLRAGGPAKRPRWDELGGRLFAWIVLVLATMTLAESVFGWNLGIDQVLFRRSLLALGIANPGRMAPHTTLNFILLAGAILLLDVTTRRGRRPAEFLALSGGFIGMLTLIGYLYGVGSLIGTMALHTALTFVLLSMGIMAARPSEGLMATITGAGAGGVMVRRLGPAVVAAPTLVGWIILIGGRQGYYAASFGIALFTLLLIGVFAVLGLSNAQSLNRIDLERQRAKELSDRLAADNARLYMQERNVSQTLQASLLKVPERLPGVDFGHLYRGATEVAMVGGDFYDLFELEHGRIGVVIGDVTGKGLEAATLTALIKNSIKAYAFEGESPASVMAKTNILVGKTFPAYMFATAVLGILDPGTKTLRYSNAGHPQPLLKKKGGTAVFLTTGSPALGVLADLEYAEDTSVMEADDVLLLYTDGVTEARRDNDFFGEARLAAYLGRLEPVETEEIPQMIFQEISRFSDGWLADDVAILAVAMAK